jgi:hypothetical protein
LSRKARPSPHHYVFDFPNSTRTAADIRIAAECTPLEVADTPLEVADTPLEVADTPLEVADTPLEVADTPLEVADTPLEVGRNSVA